MFVPKRAHSRGCVERRGGNRLADRFESPVGLTGVSEYAIPTNELDASLPLRALDSRDQNRTDFAGHPDMRTAACGPVVSGDIDHANVTAPLRRLPQSGFGDILVRNVSNRDASIFANDPVGEVFCRFRLFT